MQIAAICRKNSNFDKRLGTPSILPIASSLHRSPGAAISEVEVAVQVAVGVPQLALPLPEPMLPLPLPLPAAKACELARAEIRAAQMIAVTLDMENSLLEPSEVDAPTIDATREWFSQTGVAPSCPLDCGLPG